MASNRYARNDNRPGLREALIATLRRDDLCDDTEGEHHTDEYIAAFLTSLDVELRGRAALLDEPVPPKSPYRDADEHERQSLAGTHLFDAACFWCLLGWYEHPPEAEPVPLDVERLAQTGVNVWGWDISRARQYAEQFAAEYARLTDPKGATE